MELLLALAVGSTWAGLAAHVAPAEAALAGILAVGLLLLGGSSGRRPAKAALGLAGGLWGALALPSPSALPAGSVEVVGTVYDVRCDTPPRCRVTLADVLMGPLPEARRATAWFTDLETTPIPGDRIVFEGEVRAPREALNPSPFLRLDAEMPVYVAATTQPAAVDEAPRWQTAVALALRAELDFDNVEATAFLRALVLGDKTDLTQRARWAFQDTGTAHILAISGLHLALIGFGLRSILLTLLLRWRRMAQSRRVAAVAAAAALPLVWAYTEVIAPSDATRRAFVFIAIVFVGEIFARRARGPRTLALAAIVAVLADPTAALRPSFQLSFAAAAALTYGAPLGRQLAAWLEAPGRVERPAVRRAILAVAGLAWVDLLSFVATSPLTAAWFGQVAPHGLWVNLIAVPASLLILPVAALWSLVALAWPALGAATADVPAGLAGLFIDGVHEAAAVAGPSSVAAWPVALAAGAVALFLVALASRKLRALAGAGLLLTSVVGGAAAAPPRGDFLVTALDVGHGDALLVELPQGGAALVDAGGTWQGGESDLQHADRNVVAPLLQRGIASLDAFVLTHTDRDHIGGAQTVVERIAVRSLWLSPCALATPRGRLLAETTIARGGVVIPLVRQPPVAWQGVELEVLWPDERQLGWDGGCRVGVNDASIALAMRFAGRALLLTGDIEAPSEAALLAHGTVELRADVLKSPHHGSKSSSTPEFLDAVGASHVIVSGLPGRLPMPPHASVLERYRARGAQIWMTGLDGAVTATFGRDGGLEISSHRPRWAALWPGSWAHMLERRDRP